MRKEGFEPSRLTAPPPQDGASASSATSAWEGCRKDSNKNYANSHPKRLQQSRGANFSAGEPESAPVFAAKPEEESVSTRAAVAASKVVAIAAQSQVSVSAVAAQERGQAIELANSGLAAFAS